MNLPQRHEFPFLWALSWSLLIGGIYFLPQALHLWQARAPQVLLEENFDEMAYAVWASRAAGEHSNQPDPYQLGSSQLAPVSFATVQPLPAWAIGGLAWGLRQPVTIIFMLGSFLWPTVIAFLFFMLAWLTGIQERMSLAFCVAFTLLMLPPILWLMQWKYTKALWGGTYPGFRLTLPYSRRYQPQFTAVIHYAAIVFSLLSLRAKGKRSEWLAGVIAGVAFGLSFYCYYFSWTILLGWFVLGGCLVWFQSRERCQVWGAATLLGLLISIPYFVLLARHFSDISMSAASARVRSLPSDPAIYATLLVCLLLVGAIAFDRAKQLSWWVPLILNFVALLGALQNVVTGIYIQPYHYLHYFARPTTNLALVALWVWISKRWLAEWRIVRYANIAALALCLCVALIFQVARYRDVVALAREAVAVQPALQALREQVAAGSVVFSPDPTAHETIPLYTDAIPYFSRFMLLNETPRTQAAIQARIVATQWLNGMSVKMFSNWIKAQPIDAFFQLLQRPPNEQTQKQIAEVTESLTVRFARWEQEPDAEALRPLRYALLPKKAGLPTTRLPQYFNCQLIWSDEHYSLFALALR